MSEFTPRHMMATRAIHQLGDLSRDEEEYCYVTEHDLVRDGYIGSWCEGYGFFNVLFPSETTRELTEAEQEELSKKKTVIIGFGSPI